MSTLAEEIAEAQTLLTSLKAAYAAAVAGKRYTITVGSTSKSFERNDIKTILDQIKYWEAYIAKRQSGTRGIPVKFGTPFS